MLWVCFTLIHLLFLNTTVLKLSLSTGHDATEVQIPSADTQQGCYITGINEVMLGPKSLYAYIPQST